MRADRAAYEQCLLRWLEAAGHGYAISADMSRELATALQALPEPAWHLEREDSDAIQHWTEAAYVVSDGVATKDRAGAAALSGAADHPKAGRLFADGGEVKHFAIITDLPDPDGGRGLDLIRWHRVRQARSSTPHVLSNELAAAALPSQKFAADAAWFPLYVLLDSLLAAFKRVALPKSRTAPGPSNCASCS